MHRVDSAEGGAVSLAARRASELLKLDAALRRPQFLARSGEPPVPCIASTPKRPLPMKYHFRLFALCLLALFASHKALGQTTVLNTFPVGNSGFFLMPGTGGAGAAQLFTTDSSGLSLSSVTAQFENFGGPTNWTPVVQVVGDSGGLPNTGNVIATLTSDSGSSLVVQNGLFSFSFSAATAVALSTNTNFWITFGGTASGGSAFGVDVALGAPNGPRTDAAATGAWYVQGTNFNVAGANGTNLGAPIVPGVVIMSITAVPEPSTVVLLLIGAAALGFGAWRRSRAA